MTSDPDVSWVSCDNKLGAAEAVAWLTGLGIPGSRVLPVLRIKRLPMLDIEAIARPWTRLEFPLTSISWLQGGISLKLEGMLP